jgi:hypothetical protein
MLEDGGADTRAYLVLDVHQLMTLFLLLNVLKNDFSFGPRSQRFSLRADVFIGSHGKQDHQSSPEKISSRK